MTKAGSWKKEPSALKDGKVEARMRAGDVARIDELARSEGLDRSKWVRKTLADIARRRGYDRLAPIDIADLCRAVVLIEAGGQNHPALPLIRGVLARHELS